jgi:hypothetical protein
MVSFRLFNEDLGTSNVSKQGNSYLLSYPCSSTNNQCTPYVSTLPRGKYRFELWGAGNYIFKNGGYVSGILNIEKEETFYFFVGGVYSLFNSVHTNIVNNVVKGNGASDIRLEYYGEWHNFVSLKSRIIVAGAGGNEANITLGSSHGVSVISGNYGYAGGLTGYGGLYGYAASHSSYVIYPGDPGGQSKGGIGGLCTYCNTRGESGSFGKGGISGIGCYQNKSVWNEYRYHGSGGYYGSGGSGGPLHLYWDPFGTGGGSSFISGHRGCNSITEDSTESNIIHTNHPYHYSGLTFYDTKMIDGSGSSWMNKTVGNKNNMPNPHGGLFSLSEGNVGNGFIRITIFKTITCLHREYYFPHFLFTLLVISY